MAPVTPGIAARQATTGSSPNTSCSNGLGGGAVAGIVIGSIAGTLLILWLIRLCRMPGAPAGGEPDYGYRTGITNTRGRHRRRSSGGSYVIEKPTSGSRRYRDEVRRPAKVYMSNS